MERFSRRSGRRPVARRSRFSLGFRKGISGAEPAERACEQAVHFGSELLLSREGVRDEYVPGKGAGYLADGTKIVARCTICAIRRAYRLLNLPRGSSWEREQPCISRDSPDSNDLAIEDALKNAMSFAAEACHVLIWPWEWAFSATNPAIWSRAQIFFSTEGLQTLADGPQSLLSGDQPSGRVRGRRRAPGRRRPVYQ